MDLEDQTVAVPVGSPVPVITERPEEAAASTPDVQEDEASGSVGKEAGEVDGEAAEVAEFAGSSRSASSAAEEAPVETGINFGSSLSLDAGQFDDYYRKLQTMEFEPKNNVRTEFGRLGPDARCYVENLERIHMSPGIATDPLPTSLRYALDADGYPLQLRGESEFRRGQMLSPEEEQALVNENPEILKPFRRTREHQWRWEVTRMRTKPTQPAAWCRYISLCADPPGEQLDADEWPGLAHLEALRHPVVEKKEQRTPEAKVESQGQLEFKKTAFDLITKETNGRISREDALTLASLWGYVPSELDKKRFLEKKDTTLSNKEFQFWLTHSLSHPEDRNLDEIKAAFRAVDFTKSGFISEFSLCSLLTQFGEPLDPEEVREILTRTGCQSGKINYDEFLEELWAQNRKLPLPTAYTTFGLTTRQLPPMVETEVAHF